jgi:predicted outer membrane repeat protein
MWSPSVFALWKSRSQRRSASKPAPPRRQRFRPLLEALEDRWVPSTLHVTSNADNGAAGTLRWAVQQATKNDTIEIDTTQTIVLTQGGIDLRKDLTFEAAKNTTATVSGGFTSNIFRVEASVTLQNLDLIDGNFGDGGAVSVWTSNLTIENCTFSGNAARDDGGGAIADFGGNLTVNNCVFSGNNANSIYGVGGAICAFPINVSSFRTAYPTLSINNSTFSGNTAVDGGAIYDDGTISRGKTPQMGISGCTFTGNSATDGGAVYVDTSSSNVAISNSSFVKNTATQQGGAIYSLAGGPLTVTQDTFSGNTPDNIFAIYGYIDGGGNIGL